MIRRSFTRSVSKTLTALSLLAVGLLAGAPGAMALGPNIMSDPGFEHGGFGAAGWTENNTTVFTMVTGNAHSGTYALQATTGNWLASNTNSAAIEAWPNTSYTASFWYKGTGTLQLNVGPYQANISPPSSTTYTQYTVQFTTSSTTTSLSFSLYNGPNAVAGTSYYDDFSIALTNSTALNFTPSNPGASGMSLIQDDEFNDNSTIDVNATGNIGYHWYPQQFFSLGTTTPSSYSIVPTYQGASGVLAFNNSPNTFSDVLHSALPESNSSGYAGNVFTSGQGIYFEGRIALANLSVLTAGNNDPGFWMQDMGLNTGWNAAVAPMPGWPGHLEGVEDDIIEYNPSWAGGSPTSPTNSFNSAQGDWWDGGVIGNASHTVFTPAGYDYTQWHTYGLLWVPATAANGWNGYRQVYVDGVPGQAVCWVGNQISPTNPPSGSYKWSHCDADFSDLILGSGNWGVNTMYVDYVHVYAVNSASSMKTVPIGLLAPTNLSAGNGLNAQVPLAWTTASGATSYNVYRGSTWLAPAAQIGVYTLIASGITGTNYTDTAVLNGTAYYYSVASVSSSSTSRNCNPASATPQQLGTNLLVNPGFESGTTGYGLFQTPFVATNNAANAHSGTWEAVGTISGTPTYNWISQTVSIATNTTYASSLWVKGSGKFTFEVLDDTWNQNSPLASTVITAGASWTQIFLPNFNSGANTFVYFNIRDDQTVAGTVYIDDCFFGTAGGGAPAAPTGLGATAGNAQVALLWTASTGSPTSYNVYRGTTAGGESATAVATGITATAYTNTGLADGATYYYKVAAVNSSGTSGYSNEASAKPIAPAFVQGAAGHGGATASSVAAAFTSAQTAGNLNVVVVGWQHPSNGVSTITDSAGNTYTLAVGPTLYSTKWQQSIYYSSNIKASASNTVTVTFNGQIYWPAVHIIEFTGASTLDVTATGTGSSATPVTSSATTTAANEAITGGYTGYDPVSAAGSGFTLAPNDGFGYGAEYKIVSATGNYNAGLTTTASGVWVMQMATFK